MDAASFLEVLFGDAVSPSAKIVVWQELGKRAEWFDNIPAAVEFAKSVHAKGNTYFGVCLHDEQKAKADSKAAPEFARGSARSATVIGGIWMDIDIKSEKHTKAGLAPNLNLLVDALNALPLKPSILNTTGGGVHAWFMFREPWVLEDDKERARAQSIVEGFQRYVQVATGFTVDTTHDLARVLRMPGSINHKHKPKVTVTCSVPFTPMPRYNPSDFEDFAAKPRSIAKIEPTHPLQIDLEAELPKKFLVLLANDVELHATWVRTLPQGKKWSDSEWDISLASRLVNRPDEENWTDQEICDVMIAHRKKHGSSMDRADFNAGKFAHTIGKARAQRKARKLEEHVTAEKLRQLDQIADSIQEIDRHVAAQPITQTIAVLSADGEVDVNAVQAAPMVTAVDPLKVERQTLQAAGFVVLNELLEIPKEKAMVRLVRYAGDEGVYVLTTNAGLVRIGGIEFLDIPQKFAQRLADGTQHVLRKIKADEWRGADGILPRLLRLVEKVDLEIGGDKAVSLAFLLRKYTDQQIQTSRDMGLMQNLPFIEGGEVYGSLQGIINTQNSLPRGFQIFKDIKDLGIAMRNSEHESREFNFHMTQDTHGRVVKEKRNKRSAWRLTSKGRLIADPDVVVIEKTEENPE